MKLKITTVLWSATGILALAPGCSKPADVPPQAIQKATPLDTSAVDAGKAAETAARERAGLAKAAEIADAEAAKLKAEADKLAAGKAEAEKAAADLAAAEQEKVAAQKLAEAAARQEQSRISGLIDSARNLLGKNQYAEALKLLGELSNAKLTSAQTSLVEELKTAAEKQAEQALIDKAASQVPSGVGNVLKGNN